MCFSYEDERCKNSIDDKEAIQLSAEKYEAESQCGTKGLRCKLKRWEHGGIYAYTCCQHAQDSKHSARCCLQSPLGCS